MPENPARWRWSWSKMECIHGQSLILCTIRWATTSAPALHLGTVILFLQKRSNPALCCKLSIDAHVNSQSAGWLISFSLDHEHLARSEHCAARSFSLGRLHGNGARSTIA